MEGGSNMLKQMNILILGGDQRYLPVIKILAENGATIYLAGFDQLQFHQSAIIHTELETCDFKQIDAILLPVAGTDEHGKVEAAYSDNPLYLTKNMIHKTPEHCTIYTGISNPFLDQEASIANRQIIRIFERNDVAVLNSIPTAEGALKLAIEQTDVTIHGANILILGFGRVAMTVSRVFSAVGANVSVCARKPSDLARIQEMRLHPVPFQYLSKTIGDQQVIINTIPKQILDANVISNMDKASTIIDLASRPGGTDFDHAAKQGIKAIHALGLPGKTAPQTAGEIIAKVFMELLS